MNVLARKVATPVRREIPGGSTMLETLDGKGLETACYNWLRGTKDFDGFVLSLAKDPDLFKTQRTKVEDFPRATKPIWVTHPDGKRFLARKISEILVSKKVLAIEVTKDGIFTIEDREGVFGPYRKATVTDVEAGLAEEPGQKVSSENWKPYIEFLTKPKFK